MARTAGDSPGTTVVTTPATRRRRSAWFGAAVGTLLTLGLLAGASAVLLRQAAMKQRVVGWLAGPQKNRAPWPGRRDFTLRDVVLAERARAAARGDLGQVAALNGQLAQEALLRAAATQRAWVSLRNPQTKLIGERAEDATWRYKNMASDCFGFLVQAGVRLNPDTLPALAETLAAEARLAPPGELCQDYNAATGARVDEDAASRMFGSTEYVKDGLLSVFERYGDLPAAAAYRDRMFQVMDAILARSAQPSQFGALPGTGAEENGNCLQAFSRLSYAAPNGPAYAELAARIADAYVRQAMPKNNGLPPKHFDWAAGKVAKNTVQLRDHGNESMPGLSEAYALAVSRMAEPAWRARADAWAEPIARMYETALAKGIGGDGLLVSALDGATLAQKELTPNDNWAYLLNGALLFGQAARKHGTVSVARLEGLEAAADRVCQAVARQYGLAWEWDSMDGYCDTLEGAMYMIRHRPSQAATLEPWVDDQIENLFERQLTNGVVHGDYLDGNFIRTALMYADLRAGGWTADPWRPDVRVGFARDPATGEAAVSVECGGQPYRGTIRPDKPRHRDVMKLPWDWPRLNHWPEHYVPGETVRAVAAEGLPTPSADEVRAGIKVDLAANGRAVVRLR